MEFSDELIKLFESDEGLFDPPKKAIPVTSDDRLTESFKKITEFVEQHNRMPSVDAQDISEAMIATRLAAIRNDAGKVAALKPVDTLGLLDMPAAPASMDELFSNDTFGLFNTPADQILDVKHVPVRLRSPIESKAQRTRAQDFESYKAGFEEQQVKLASGELKLVRYTTVDQLYLDHYYVQDGLMLKIIDVGEKKRVYDRNKERFRVIFENGTESNMYRRSLSQRLYENGFAVVAPDYTGEYAQLSEDDVIKGYIYVLASKSTAEHITAIQDLYKIGFSTTPVAERIKHAKKDPTYLMSDVEVVDSYTVTGDYNPQKIEHFLHRIFSEAAIDINIIDADGNDYRPREWYTVPLPVIEQAINLLLNGDIIHYHYDATTQKIVPTT
ncbi:MAG: hypothetical protein JWM81_1046 [Candidatus Saccharibacteria bacterium]|nr:hypothetical protein [Candidatus Saccharibacteria bacterium]